MKERRSKLLLGVGNVLQHDDGFGVRIAEVMATWSLPSDIEVCEAGTAAAELSSLLINRDLVLVVDAINAGADPGTIFRLRPDELRATVRTGLSLHDLHWLDALNQTRILGVAPPNLQVIAVQIDDVSTGIGLSPTVASVVNRVIELAGEILGLPTDGGPRELATSIWQTA